MYKEAFAIFEKAISSLNKIEDLKHRRLMELTVKFNQALLAETSCLTSDAKKLYKELVDANPLFQGTIY